MLAGAEGGGVGTRKWRPRCWNRSLTKRNPGLSQGKLWKVNNNRWVSTAWFEPWPHHALMAFETMVLCGGPRGNKAYGPFRRWKRAELTAHRVQSPLSVTRSVIWNQNFSRKFGSDTWRDGLLWHWVLLSIARNLVVPIRCCIHHNMTCLVGSVFLWYFAGAPPSCVLKMHRPSKAQIGHAPTSFEVWSFGRPWVSQLPFR